jgi:hypothetical protein
MSGFSHDEIWNANGEPLVTASEMWAEGQADDMAQADLMAEDRWNAIEEEIPLHVEHVYDAFKDAGVDDEYLEQQMIDMIGRAEERYEALWKELQELKAVSE